MLLASAALLAAAGCLPSDAPAPTLDVRPIDLPGEEALRERLDQVLEDTYHHRHLTLADHACWQIMHGILAFGREFPVENADGERISAVDYLLAGGEVTGWTFERGRRMPDGRYGLRAVLEAGSRTGQGHYDQWLQKLSRCDLPADTPIVVRGHEYTMMDFVRQVQWDVPRNHQQEYSWTLFGLTAYLPTDAEWTAGDGATWSIERLLAVELDQDLNTSACGGTHRLVGITVTLNRHLDERRQRGDDGPPEGVWRRADELIRQSIHTARRWQNPDGSFSASFFSRPGSPADISQDMHATGHTFEFLAYALTDEQLREPWMVRAALHLCDLLERTERLPLDCGPLYHAASGLVIYRERLYGARSWKEPLTMAARP